MRTFVATAHRVNPQANVTLLCHSYGSVVCGQAAPLLDVASIVLFASLGVDESDVAALHTRAAVWAGRGSGDGIAKVPHLSIGLPGDASLGFSQDPTASAFGARRFAAGDGGHSDYFTPGSLVSLSAPDSVMVTAVPSQWPGTTTDGQDAGKVVHRRADVVPRSLPGRAGHRRLSEGGV
ncbi:hypothetical protein GCM10018980_70720 [Streptomyces capoamus]|uniref:DUF1023 domain-containing protein n=1 Tax=Streptomyces capoamus TaxID=68183 RepID=A0A919F3B6_9ACTN|nr:hypothetical protein GCM10010501_17400 [Streptomyces libani subsp. rufus]GHG74061.1 hypothetical protein GCM10018980_70720 [Streptomyces capoamus]